MCTSHTLQKGSMGFPQKPARDRQFFKRGHRLVHGLDIISNLLPVIALFRIDVLDFLQYIFNIGLRAFDTTAGGGFFTGKFSR